MILENRSKTLKMSLSLCVCQIWKISNIRIIVKRKLATKMNSSRNTQRPLHLVLNLKFIIVIPFFKNATILGSIIEGGGEFLPTFEVNSTQFFIFFKIIDGIDSGLQPKCFKARVLESNKTIIRTRPKVY